MRKRVTRPPRFAAIDNKAIDSLPSILGIGLLTRLIRARDGDHVTVESLARDYSEGEAALSRAMRELVQAGNVVKLKVQRARSETVVGPNGSPVLKRGGSWWTTFSVDSIPFTPEDVADMLAELMADGNVKKITVEPEHLDPRKAGRAAPGSVGPTSCDQGRQRPAPRKPGAGQPAPGEAGTLSNTVPETSSSASPALPAQSRPQKTIDSRWDDPQTAAADRARDTTFWELPGQPPAVPAPRREQPVMGTPKDPPPAAVGQPPAVPAPRREQPVMGTPMPEDPLSAAVGRIVAAWAASRRSAGVGPHRKPSALAEFTESARALVASGESVEWLVSVAAWMGAEKPAWWQLGLAAKAQCAGAPTRSGGSTREVRRLAADKCPRHPVLPLDCPTCRREEEQLRGGGAAGLSLAEILATEGVSWQPKATV
ncbi:hypothetical protein [Kitasatospora sp. NPDC001175]|uniref:hypothetical protein n=1 Tax=Kitasatospora sp. NPDC001175 TaxID=3157103 RepID=UPI003D076250